MQINKNIVYAVLIIAIFLIGIVFLTGKSDSYYYTYSVDQNTITQTVQVYNANGDLLKNYNLYLDDELIGNTESDTSTVSISLCDLSEHPNLVLELNDKEFKIVYKKG